MFVLDGAHESIPKPVLSEVPQDSVLGPLLFLIRINDGILALTTSNLSTILSAGDTLMCLPHPIPYSLHISEIRSDMKLAPLLDTSCSGASYQQTTSSKHKQMCNSAYLAHQVYQLISPQKFNSKLIDLQYIN